MSLLKSYFKVNLLYRMLGALVIGMMSGLFLWWIQLHTDLPIPDFLRIYVQPLGMILVSLLKMVVIPIVFFSLIAGASSLPLKQFGRVGLKVMGWYIGTSLIAALLGTAIALWIRPGESVIDFNRLSGTQALESGIPEQIHLGIGQLLIGMFENPFSSLSRSQFLPIIVFAILFGLAYRVVLEQNRTETNRDYLSPILNLINQSLFRIVDWIMEYAPVGILALSIVNFSSLGPQLILPYFRLAVGVILGIMVMIGVVYSGLVMIFLRRSPWGIYKQIQSAIITAFVTRSSAATLPITLKTVIQRLGVRRELAEFSLPLGATINMDGVCIHLPMFAVLAAALFSIPLGFSRISMMVLMTVLASIGAGGVPGGSLMLLFIILDAIGLSETQTASIVLFAMGINPILDMFETANNVTGDIICTYVVGTKENMIEPILRKEGESDGFVEKA
ncbi:MAG: dicarboxylate/amino acid:cation symporter [Candidatus Delongbacteria bacterium]|nr:dicarboxylate/amino acid:cation symporter [Candidatus Delongbacteria bacterium]